MTVPYEMTTEGDFKVEFKDEINSLIQEYHSTYCCDPGVTFLFFCHNAIEEEFNAIEKSQSQEQRSLFQAFAAKIDNIVSRRLSNLYCLKGVLGSEQELQRDSRTYPSVLTAFKSKSYANTRFELDSQTLRELRSLELLPSTLDECEEAIEKANRHQILCLRNQKLTERRLFTVAQYIERHGLHLHNEELFNMLEGAASLPPILLAGNGIVNDFIELSISKAGERECSVERDNLTIVHSQQCNKLPPHQLSHKLSRDDLNQITVCQTAVTRHQPHVATVQEFLSSKPQSQFDSSIEESRTHLLNRRFDLTSNPLVTKHSYDHNYASDEDTVRYVITGQDCQIVKSEETIKCDFPVTPPEFEDSSESELTKWYAFLQIGQRALSKYEIVGVNNSHLRITKLISKIESYLKVGEESSPNQFKPASKLSN